MGVFQKFVPLPIEDSKLYSGLQERGYKVGPSVSINHKPMHEINGVFVEPSLAYLLLIDEMSFDQVLADPSTVVPKG